MTSTGPSCDNAEQGVSLSQLITITDATPQKTSTTGLLSTPITSTSPHTPASVGKGTDHFPPCRLLYRGALSLPDSHLQLDGIAFSARLPSRHVASSTSALQQHQQDSPSSSCARSFTRADSSSARELMYNPLALALESMRGRQTLRFKGTVDLQEVWTDDTGDVYMDIHPLATLTRIYFENVLCLSELVAPSHDASGPKRTRVGVRVSLGDTDGPETTDIVIYGEASPSLRPPPLPLQLSAAAMSTSVGGPPPLNVRVARVTSAPRAPRPDDPTPRQPPARLSVDSTTTLSDLGRNKRITPRSSVDRERGKTAKEDPVLRRAREVMLHLPRSNENGRGKGKDKGKGKCEGGDFKVPELPAKVRRKQGAAETDAFGAVELPQPESQSSINGKGKGKATVVTENGGDIGIANPIEDANKLVLKKLAVHCLSNAGIPRTHAEFKDIFGFVYRGATFALVKASHISAQAAEAMVEAHVKMYVLTLDGAHDSSGVSAGADG